MLKEVARLKVTDDGLDFDPESVTVEEIREQSAYGGLRVKMISRLGSAKLLLQVDVGLGDSVYPETSWADFPALLDFSPPRIRAYRTETVTAEKFQAIVELGLRNSRMKDYYDIYYMQKRFEYSGAELREAISQTFKRRKTDIPHAPPDGLTADFANNPQKQIQWQAFLRKNGLIDVGDLPQIVESARDFLMPLLTDAQICKQVWRPEEGWKPTN